MKRFDLITEADARVLDIGEHVTLAAGGHITPLAWDTLRARKVVVASSVIDEDDASLLPAFPVDRVVIGSDHSGVALKIAIRENLRGKGLAVQDVGADGPDPVDYPDIAAQVARLVARREADVGVVIDGAGLGSAIAANKVDGIRAAMCMDLTLARYAREHNGANVLALGATLLTTEMALDIVRIFLDTPMREARYIRRLRKVRNLERTG